MNRRSQSVRKDLKDAQQDKRRVCDVLKAGIVDPTKVSRLALQNAASVVGLLLTTEVMIADAPKDEADHGHGHGGGGGGMGGMGDMGM